MGIINELRNAGGTWSYRGASRWVRDEDRAEVCRLKSKKNPRYDWIMFRVEIPGHSTIEWTPLEGVVYWLRVSYDDCKSA